MSPIFWYILWFLLLSVIVKAFMITKSSIRKIQNLVVNPKSLPVKSNSIQQCRFLFKYVSSKKSMTEFFEIKKKTYFGVIFSPKGILPKNSGKYNCIGTPTFICKRYRVDWPSNQKIIPSLSTSKNHSTNLLNSWNYFWDTPDLRVPWSLSPRPFFDNARLIIIKFLAFLNLYQYAKNQLISSINSWHKQSPKT